LEPVMASAPSNIALIKYMGKIENTGNKPTNASLSYTLDHLRTFVRLTPIESLSDQWQPLKGDGLQEITLSEKGQARFLKHLQNLKSKWGVEQNFLVESANNFPSDCGLASSASSFAALTLAAAEMFQKLKPQPWGADMKELSSLSRQGSGSSCRSLYTPWALWKDEFAQPMSLPVQDLHHICVIVEDTKKEVSSSEAHKLVTTSPRFEGRIERAEMRLADLSQALQFDDWHMARQIVWDEFIDMHRLFETSTPAFGYMTVGSHEVLDECQALWNKWQDGPLVTMDAGANVHLLFHNSKVQQFEQYKDIFAKKFKVIAHQVVKK